MLIRKGAVVEVTCSGTLVSTKRYRPRGRSLAALWPLESVAGIDVPPLLPT
jgi:hypothetical protein